jgi:DNA polymerase alpha subunit A
LIDVNASAQGNETDTDVTMGDMYNEFDQIRKKSMIREFESCVVSRQYAFEIPGIPLESDYLKVVYPFTGIFSIFKC